MVFKLKYYYHYQTRTLQLNGSLAKVSQKSNGFLLALFFLPFFSFMFRIFRFDLFLSINTISKRASSLQMNLECCVNSTSLLQQLDFCIYGARSRLNTRYNVKIWKC
jgi:hypothetical protein